MGLIEYRMVRLKEIKDAQIWFEPIRLVLHAAAVKQGFCHPIWRRIQIAILDDCGGAILNMIMDKLEVFPTKVPVCFRGSAPPTA